MGRCHGPFITLSCHTRTHTHKHSYSYSHSHTHIFIIVFVALTFMLIANGVTNIIHWIKIREFHLIVGISIMENCTKQFHDYSLQVLYTWDWDCFFLLLQFISISVVKVKKRAEKIHREKCKSPSVWACEFLLLLFFFAFFLIWVNRILSIERSKWLNY